MIASKQRKRFAQALVLLIVVSLMLGISGCARKTTFTDGAGRTITLPKTPQRIVSLSPAHTETLFALGVGSKVVGVSNFCNRPAEVSKIEKVGDAFSVNKEKLISLKPDILFCSGTPDSQTVKLVESTGIPVYVSSPASVEEVFQDVERMAEILGVPKQGKELVSKLKADLPASSSSSSKPKVFVLIDKDLWTAGPGSFLADVVAKAGGTNYVQSASAQYLQVSMEQLLANQPDLILVTIPSAEYEIVKAKPGWDTLKAVKEGKVKFVDPDIVSRPCPSVVQGIKEIAKAISDAK